MTIETNQPYVLTQDTKGILSVFDKNYPDRFYAGSDQYLGELVQAISLAYPNIKAYTETEIEFKLGKKVSTTLEQNPNRICLCLDRFLLKDIENKFPGQFARLGITRTASEDKTSRQGNLPLNQQFRSIVNLIQGKPVIIVDDGLFSGGTTQFVADKLCQFGIKKYQIEKVIAFLGNSQTTQVDGIPVEFIADIPNLFEWIDIRDFGIFGGRQLASSRNNKVSTAIPYLFPWSQGESASLEKSGQLFTVSQKMIQSFISLISNFENVTGKSLKFRDFVKAGFPLPTNKEKTIPVSINTDPKEYLENCLKMIENEQQRQVIILDMDGTLYELDGENNGYSGSSLETKVLDNCRLFIVNKESCSPEQAEMIMNQGLRDRIGLSNFLAQRYGITRKQYFDEVWDIDPQGIVFNYQIPVEAITKLSQTGKKLVLLTSAPQVWQQRVAKFLGIRQYFESVYTGEDFSQKEEIFSMLAQRYEPFKILSIGDQEPTDIAPAAALGLSTLLIRNPNDLERLL
ncbi:MAG: HAD family hydrolase [Candidatus Beckwithbacteria bacterium]